MSVLVEIVVALFHGDRVWSETIFVSREQFLQLHPVVYTTNELAGAEVAQQTFGFPAHIHEINFPSRLALFQQHLLAPE